MPGRPLADADAPSRFRDGLLAVAVAGTVSGAPSTIHALLGNGSALTLSLSWGAVLARVLPQWADHLVFGAVFGAVLDTQDRAAGRFRPGNEIGARCA